MVCLYTGFADVLLELEKQPTAELVNHTCTGLDGRDEKLLQWIGDSGLACLLAPHTGRGVIGRLSVAQVEAIQIVRGGETASFGQVAVGNASATGSAHRKRPSATSTSTRTAATSSPAAPSSQLTSAATCSRRWRR